MSMEDKNQETPSITEGEIAQGFIAITQRAVDQNLELIEHDFGELADHAKMHLLIAVTAIELLHINEFFSGEQAERIQNLIWQNLKIQDDKEETIQNHLREYQDLLTGLSQKSANPLPQLSKRLWSYMNLGQAEDCTKAIYKTNLALVQCLGGFKFIAEQEKEGNFIIIPNGA